MTLVLFFRLTNPTESKAHLFGFRTLLMDSQFQKLRLSTQAKPGATAIPVSYTHLDVYKRQLKDSLLRFPGGTYLLWYPQLTRLEAHDLPPRLKRLPVKNWLHVALRIKTPAADGFGMHGSGLFVINPPWTLQATLQEVMPWLVDVLGLDQGAAFTLESQQP